MAGRPKADHLLPSEGKGPTFESCRVRQQDQAFLDFRLRADLGGVSVGKHPWSVRLHMRRTSPRGAGWVPRAKVGGRPCRKPWVPRTLIIVALSLSCQGRKKTASCRRSAESREHPRRVSPGCTRPSDLVGFFPRSTSAWPAAEELIFANQRLWNIDVRSCLAGSTGRRNTGVKSLSAGVSNCKVSRGRCPYAMPSPGNPSGGLMMPSAMVIARRLANVCVWDYASERTLT